jgi:multidrug efflux pump subunit AcrB
MERHEQPHPKPQPSSLNPQPPFNLARFAFRNSRGILLTAVFISILGGLMLARMPAAILPDFPYPRLGVIVQAGDLAIQDMVVRVTRPLEAAAAGVPGAKLVRSHTSRGAIEMSIDFDWGTDMFEAYTRLNAFVAAIRGQLPPGVEVQIEWIQPSIFPIIGISLSSDRVSLRDLRDQAQLTMAPFLSRLEGVYRANALGGQVREYQVLVDPQALAEQNLTIDDVNRALTAANLVRSVGRFNQHAQSFLVLVDAQVPRPERLLEMAITARGSRVVRIADVATVREGDEELTHVVVAGYRDAVGRPITREAVQIDIYKQPGASTAQVSDEVTAALAQLQSQLPPGTVVRTFYNEADLLHESQGSLRDSILVGSLLAMLVLLVALRSWRSMGIVLICIPITILLAFGCLKLLGQSLNLMTLGGLAVGLGLIIDDVVVTLENIYRHLEMGKSPLEAAIDGAGEIQKPMIGSTLTTVAVFLPLSFLGEIIGGLFSPLSITLVILLVGSVLLAVTLVPLLCQLLLRPVRDSGVPGAPRREGGFRCSGVQAGPPEHLNTRTPEHLTSYDRVIRGALAAPWAVVVGAVLLGVCGLAAFRGLPTGLMPEMDESAFVLDYLAPAGTPLQETDAACRVMEQEIMATPEVEGFCRRTGLELGFFITDPNTGDNMVRLKPRSQRRRGMTEVMEDIMGRCRKRLPGMEFEVFPPIVDRVQDIAGEPSPVEVKIYGEDPKVLVELAGRVEKVLASVKGVGGGAHELTPSGPELTVRVDPTKAGLLGLSPEDVARTLELSLFGRVETYAPRGDRLIGLRAVYPKEARRTEAQIRRLPIYSKNGRVVTLEEIADIREAPGVFAVVRENQKQVLPVTGTINTRETDLGTANREVQRRVKQEIQLPPGYSIQYGGLYYTQQQSFRNLLQVLLLGALLVYIVTLFQYNRFSEPTSLVLAGALALVGVVGALYLTHTPFNVSSFTGAIMIFGMIMTNGIVLMDTIRNRISDGWPLEEAIARAGSQRLRPVLMTASIAILTLLPLAFGIGSGAEMQRPLAIAVIGGLVTSPLFTLILAPTLLYLARRGRAEKGGEADGA